ncbi:ribonuclease h1 [Plakobranchus ocellatus]|uniref:Ribonuclease h1 n=1 Tax=Plakobranchus ocellatus TaxID=259542 RepID=A0AAV3ZM21_9GAST|nr:ribonuclease h1 [Plakobranchus ocellatus]
MLREQTSSTKCSPTWAKTSTGEAKEPVENGRQESVGFGWATVIACQPYRLLKAKISKLKIPGACSILSENFYPVHISFVWIPAHIGIQGNENVDKLAKAALNRPSCSGKLICWSDLKPTANACNFCIHTIWQENWDAGGAANKLYELLPNLGEDLSKRGEGEMVMCRLRVGHTWLTQSYLLIK